MVVGRGGDGGGRRKEAVLKYYFSKERGGNEETAGAAQGLTRAGNFNVIDCRRETFARS